MKDPLVRFGVAIEDSLLRALDAVVKERGCTRSELFRDLARDEVGRAKSPRFEDLPIKATFAAEVGRTNGPFDSPEGWDRYKLFNKLTLIPSPASSLSLSEMSYAGNWHGSGQIPARAVDQGLISRFGSLDPAEGGNTARHQLVMQYRLRPTEHSELRTLAYVGTYRFNESSVGAYFNEEITPTPWLRADLGGRADQLSFAVDDRLMAKDPAAPTSGVNAAHQLSPKASLVFTPLARDDAELEVYLNYGQGFHSNDVRGSFSQPAVTPLARAIGEEIGARAPPPSLGSGGGAVAARSRQRDGVERR